MPIKSYQQIFHQLFANPENCSCCRCGQIIVLFSVVTVHLQTTTLTWVCKGWFMKRKHDPSFVNVLTAISWGVTLKLSMRNIIIEMKNANNVVKLYSLNWLQFLIMNDRHKARGRLFQYSCKYLLENFVETRNKSNILQSLIYGHMKMLDILPRMGQLCMTDWRYL